MCIAGLLDAMRSKLPASARIVWMCLENHADHNRKWAISLERIVTEVNLSLETVVRAVRLLQQHAIVRGERNGPGRNATVWHMLRSYEPSPHNGGMEAEDTLQDAGIEEEASPQKAGMNGQKPPHNEGIKQSKPLQSDGIEMRGPPQNAGISIPAKSECLTHQVSNPPKEAPFPSADRAGDRAAQSDLPKWGKRKDGNNSRVHGTNPRALGTNPRAKATNPRNGFLGLQPGFGSGPTIDATAEEVAEFHEFRSNLRIVGGSDG